MKIKWKPEKKNKIKGYVGKHYVCSVYVRECSALATSSLPGLNMKSKEFDSVSDAKWYAERMVNNWFIDCRR